MYTVIGVFLLVAGFYLLRPLLRTWKQFTWESLLILGGFAVLVGGAVGFEVLVYLYVEPESMPDLYHLEIAIEEFLEMAGASIILYAAVEMTATLCSEEFDESRASA